MQHDQAELSMSFLPEKMYRLRNVNRLFAVLSAVNRIITRKPGRQALIQEICRILVEIGEFRMARFGVPDAQGWIVPEATFGDTLGYFAAVRTSVSDIPQGRGPSGIAIRENRSCVCNDISADPAMNLWQDHAVRNGFRAMAGFPVQMPNEEIGVLTLYAVESDFFSEDEVRFLTDICTDIGYALEFVSSEERRSDAETRLARAQALAKVGGWTFDLLAGMWHGSVEASLITGLSADPLPLTTVYELIFPADLQGFKQSWERSLVTGSTFNLEHRIVVSGDIKWVQNLADIEYDAGGRPVQFSGMIKDITERRATQKELKVAQERFRIIFESSSEGILAVDWRTNSIVTVNPALCAMFNYPEAEFASLSLADLHPVESFQKVMVAYDAMAVGRNRPGEPLPCRRNDGLLFYADISASLLKHHKKEYLVCFFTDVTERKRAQDELRESEQKFRAFGEVAMDAILQIDDEGLINYWNYAAERMFGYSAEEVLGRSLHELLTLPRYCEAYYRAQGHFARTGEGAAVNRTLELTALRRTGEEFPIELSLSNFERAGRWNALGIVRDITERKRNEEALHEQAEYLRQEVEQRRNAQEELIRQQRELAELNAGLSEMVDQEVRKNLEKEHALIAKGKMASIGQLAAGVAHEINNPMAFISGNLNLLARYFDQMVRYDNLLQARIDSAGLLHKEVLGEIRASLDLQHILEEGVDVITESLDGAERVTKIVKDLKSFSRVDTIESESVALTSCMDNALNICINELKFRATIRKEYDSIPEVICNPGQLNQVFLNLLVNAGQAITPPGEIVLRSWRDNDFVYASVSDTGAGIADDVRGRIFEPFFTTKAVGDGTGLGLYISYDIVKKHKGDILLESVVGKGSTFTVKLPLTREN